jgi:anti-sigma factor RsiW
MKHFEITEWADFVRGLVSPAQREAMEQHLNGGCDKCGRIADVLGRVSQLAVAEKRNEVPDFAVHCARAIFALEQPRHVRVLDRLAGFLVFDSFREPLPAGVRSQHRVSRQTLYEAGDYSIDLRQEHERGNSRATMVGQIASRKEPGRALAGVSVVLSAGNSVLAKTVSNQFGEFQMDYPPARDMRLEIGAGEHRDRSSPKQSEVEGGLV